MTRSLVIESAGPGLTVQDFGRPGLRSFGLSIGGAADTLALVEGAVLLGQDHALAAIEMAGFGGVFRVSAGKVAIALTGAAMRADLDGAPLQWNASHEISEGQRLSIGGASSGSYGYLHVSGGIDAPRFLGSRSTHLTAGIGEPLQAGQELPIGGSPGENPGGFFLEPEDRLAGGEIRAVRSMQTDRFTDDEIRRFEETEFTRSARANRMGVRMEFDGEPFSASGQLSILSEVIVPGDIQLTGEGRPYVLLPECQTTGGYPRIGTVVPQDLPAVAQAGAGRKIRFRFVDQEEALKSQVSAREAAERICASLRPLTRHPDDISDLLSYQLISGAISGAEQEQGA